KQTYETDYRPNYELYLALSWGGCGILCAILMHLVSGFSLKTTLIMTSVFFVVALYQATFARIRFKRLVKLERQEQNFLSLDEMQEKLSEDSLFLGHGFEWTATHAQQVSDLYRDPERLGEI